MNFYNSEYALFSIPLYFDSDVIVPLGICVVLPVVIVWLVMRARQNETDRKAEIMLRAIEAGVQPDADFFKSSSQCAQKQQKTLKERLLGRLTGGLVTSFMGLAFLLVAFITPSSRKMPWIFSDIRLAGAILLAVGLALLVTYFVGRKMLAKEIEAEEKNLSEGR